MKYTMKRIGALIMAMAMALSMLQGAFAAETAPAVSHTFEYVEGNVAWSKDYSTATFTFTCVDGDGEKLEKSVSTSKTTKNATCTEDGTIEVSAAYTLEKNTVKGKIESGVAVTAEAKTTVAGDKATDHKWMKEKVVAPTCTTEGYTSYVCENDAKHTKQEDKKPALGHTPVYEVVNQDKVKDGSYQVETTCDLCGDKLDISEVLYAEKEIVEPTCENEGYVRYTASYQVDGKDVVFTNADELADWGYVSGAPANGGQHEWVKGTAVAPTCTENGYTPYTCSKCGAVEKNRSGAAEDVPALGHKDKTPVEENRVEATCEKDGSYDEVTYCSVCGKKVKTEKKTIPALGHDVKKDAPVLTKAATCQADGKTYQICDRCKGEVTVSVIDKTTVDAEDPTNGFHTDLREIESKTNTPATAEKDGQRDVTYSCADCGKTWSVTTETLHYWGNEDVVTKEVNVVKNAKTGEYEANNCDETQEYYYETQKKCTHCNATNPKSMEKHTVTALAHTVVTDAAVAAAWTQTGLTEGSHCAKCNKVLVKQEVTPALNTLNENWKVLDIEWVATKERAVSAEITYVSTDKNNAETKSSGMLTAVAEETAPTCTEAGYTKYYVTDENGEKHYYDGKFVTGEALGHNSDEVIPAVAPTCTKTGLTEGAKCSVCGEITTAQEVVAMTGHTFEVIPAVAATADKAGSTAGIKCSVCGEVFVAPEAVEAVIIEKEVEKEVIKEVPVEVIKEVEVVKEVEVEKPITKTAQSMTAQASKTSLKYNKKKAQTVTISTSDTYGKVTVTASKKYAGVTVKGKKITFAKGTKKGTYKFTVKAAGDKYHKAATKTITIKVK